MPAFIGAFLGALGTWLMSGIIAKVIVAFVLNGLVFGAMFLFMKNFHSSGLDYALSFFSFFGFNETVNQIQYYYSQLPPTLLQTLAYFQLGPLVGFIINNYIAGIFLAWIMRKFG